MSEETLIKRVRKGLSSRAAILAIRITFVLIALILVSDAIKTVQVLKMFDVEFGTQFWFVNVLMLLSFAVAVISIILMGRSWAWSVWVWACAVLGIAIGGVLIGLNTAFLFRWDVLLPWIALVISAILKTRFATPWKRAT